MAVLIFPRRPPPPRWASCRCDGDIITAMTSLRSGGGGGSVWGFLYMLLLLKKASLIFGSCSFIPIWQATSVITVMHVLTLLIHDCNAGLVH